MDTREVGLLIVALGVGAIVVGGLVYVGAFRWFGRLPGDLRVEGDGSGFYFPLVSCLVVSVLASLLIYLVRRFL